jgi:hypothetical protein
MDCNLQIDLPLPSNATALMQHLQRLVGVERYRWWCGGMIALQKMPTLLNKFCERYPIGRNARQRTYDRSRGHAAMHLIVYPSTHEPCDWSRTGSVSDEGHDDVHDSCLGTHTRMVPIVHTERMELLWWLVSTEGTCGLADPASPDAHVARDAMAAETHLTFRDYVLLYATKKEPRTIRTTRSGHTIAVFKDTSTWTWQMQRPVISELRAQVDRHCARLEYGAESANGRTGWGLRGLLELQRQRPLFAGVRHQVYELHRYAEDSWRDRRKAWCAAHPDLAKRYGEHAGALRPLKSVTRERLPKMVRLRVYGEDPLRVSELLRLAHRG